MGGQSLFGATAAGGVCQTGVFRRKEVSEALLVDSLHVCFLRAYHAVHELVPDVVIHELHAHGLTTDDHVRNLIRSTFTDDGAYSRRGEENFVHGYAARFVGALHQQLCHNAAQGTCKHRSHL